jgi:hypothetical protein
MTRKMVATIGRMKTEQPKNMKPINGAEFHLDNVVGLSGA